MQLIGAGVYLAALCAAAPAQESNQVFNDLDGIPRRPFDPAGKAASVLIFYWHDCPISNGYAPELNRICSSHTNFAFYIVQVDPELTAAAAREHARQFGLRAPVLLDPQHRLVKAAGATLTPEAVVFGKNGAVLYRGRIDDAYVGLGRKRDAATTHDLVEALDTIAAGKPPARKDTKPIGCLIQ